MRTAAAVIAALVACTATQATAREPIRPSEAAAHIGEDVVVDGTVNAAVCSPQACLLSFAPNFSGLVVAIAGAPAASIASVKQRYEGQRVRVRGRVSDRNGKPRIEVEGLAAIEPVGAGGEPPPGVGVTGTTGGAPQVDHGLPPAAAAPRVEVSAPPAPGGPMTSERAAALVGLSRSAAQPRRVEVSRADEPEAAGIGVDAELQLLRQQVELLTERLAAAEERLAEIDERVAEAEAEPAPADASPPSALSAFQNRHRGASDLRRVDRGWTAERLIRTLGEPAQVTGGPPGPTTWSYPQGRSVTLDERGRVVSAVGF